MSEESEGSRAIVLCGKQSSFGAAHLQPLLASSLKTLLVVFPSKKLTRKFTETLEGRVSPVYAAPPTLVSLARRTLRTVYGIARGHRLPLRNWIKPAQKHVTDALSAGIKEVATLVVDNVNSEDVIADLQNLNPDWLVSAAFPQILSRNLLEVPRLGAINFHPALLPKFRGAHPIYWAIRSGAKSTGISAHFMTQGIDEGDIIHQREISVETNETYASLYAKIVTAVPGFTREVSDLLVSGHPPRSVQFDDDATYFRNDREIHHRIFWTLCDDAEVDRIVRAGRAYFFWRGRRVRVIKATVLIKCSQLTNNLQVPPGTVVDLDELGIVVKALRGFIQLNACLVDGRCLSGEQIISELKPNLGEICE